MVNDNEPIAQIVPRPLGDSACIPNAVHMEVALPGRCLLSSCMCTEGLHHNSKSYAFFRNASRANLIAALEYGCAINRAMPIVGDTF